MSPLDEFRGAAPAAQTVSLNVPAGAGARPSSVEGGARPRSSASAPRCTRSPAASPTIVNGGVGVTLLVLEAIVDGSRRR